MKTIIKITLGISILLLLLGSTAAAFNVDSLKTVNNYNDFQNGCSTYTTNNHRYLSVEKLIGDYKKDLFTNSSDMTVSNAGDNIYSFADTTFKLYGYQEVVVVDGENYLVSINQNSKLSPSEQNTYLNDLKEFNKLNNLEPVEI